jgi:hypothetical protein
MALHRGLLALLLLAPLTLSANTGDTANERIVVTKPELEAHWQVDCAETWSILTRAIAALPSRERCDIAPDLQRSILRSIQLCVFIYQPPGASSPDNCPNYRAAHSAVLQGDCRRLTSLLAQPACSDSKIPGN